MTPDFSKTKNTSNNYSDLLTSTYRVNAMQWSCITNTLPMSQLDEIENVQFWCDGVCQFVIGSIGIVSNILAVLVMLRSRMMESIFNKFLTCLLVLHSIYISCELITEAIHPSWYSNTEDIAKMSFTIYIYYVLQPMGKFMLYSSTFFTVLMARQRYVASCKPMQHRKLTLTTNHLTHVFQNLMIVLVTSAVFTFPIYLETSIDDRKTEKLHEINVTHFKYVSSINTVLQIILVYFFYDNTY